MQQDYYTTLFLERAAEPQDIRKQYRKLALKFHPDKNSATADQFSQVTEAFHVLSDRTYI